MHNLLRLKRKWATVLLNGAYPNTFNDQIQTPQMINKSIKFDELDISRIQQWMKSLPWVEGMNAPPLP